MSEISQKNELILWYLNYDDIQITEKKILELSYHYNIPFKIFLKKLIERLITVHDTNQIIKILTNDMNLPLNKNLLEYLPELLNITQPIQIQDRNQNIDKINHELKLFNDMVHIGSNKIHRNQPLPDPEKGRPLISWCECYYQLCHEQFKYPDQLIGHLKQFNCYTPSFHKMHEVIVDAMLLDEEKIITNNMIYCPSILCKTQIENTPQGVIKHLQRLGIKPFWKPNMVFNTVDTMEEYIIDDPKIYNCENCVICLENVPNLILDTCLHNCYCLDCYVKYIDKKDIQKCPLCRTFYNYVYPY